MAKQPDARTDKAMGLDILLEVTMSVPLLTETSSIPPAPLAEGEAALAPVARGRANWSGLLKVSLVAVPVKAYLAAISTQETHFNQLHAGCGQRIRYEKHCPLHGKVEAGAIASGYACARDQYLVLDEAELDRLRPAKDKALSLEYFLDPAIIDPVLFSGRSLYLLPDGPAAQHPYGVLAQAMSQRRMGALGRMVLGGRRYLVLVRPSRRILTLHVLHYPAHLRASATCESELRLSATTDDEAKLAGLLIEAATPVAIPWADFRDDTADQLAALVEAKLQNRPLPEPAEEEVSVGNLLDALKRSVAQVQQPVLTAPAFPDARKSKRNSRRTT
jgi:DNA end-binding protein Ku